MIKRIARRILFRYESSSYITRIRARFLMYLIFAITAAAPFMVTYFVIIHLNDPGYSLPVLMDIFSPVLIGFILSFGVLFVLIRGHYPLAGNLIFIIWLSSLWAVVFRTNEEPLIRVSTIITITTVLTAMPAIIVRKRILFVLYPAANIIILFIFIFLHGNELNFSDAAFADYFSVLVLSFAGAGIISYTIFTINTGAFKRAQNEITERHKTEEQRNRLQEQLMQSQKLESMGLLAGGIAHDFNNMLTAIQGYAELIKLNCSCDEGEGSEVESIIKVSKKARDLTRQLLAFARVQPMNVRNIDINRLIGDFTGMLSRTMRGNITIINRFCGNPGSIKGDPVQLEQVILNITINAQDAMPFGGEISIETCRTELNTETAKLTGDIIPGPYMVITISDEGTGIDPEIMDNIFVPFFTTKEFGKGTGLGLSTAYGIIKQHNGTIRVSVREEGGTAFQVYLPVKDEITEACAPQHSDMISFTGTETILAVEDTPEVRVFLEKVLKKSGYRILIADNARSALSMASAHDDEIHLLVTDVVMPEMNGMELYKRLSETRPGIKVLYISGYAANMIGESRDSIMDINFIQKPFSITDFTGRVREVLDS
ncbi:MAG TPA: ATP-binding protein [Spirochaetota bacterium]|nr:ATP-binding protein [Spirochaetota bacterium]